MRSILLLLIASFWMAPGALAQDAGAKIYLQQCVRCHGKQGEGTRAYPHPLVGNRSLPQLAKYIARSMPEDAPGTCVGADAEKVAAYIYEAFYSPAAQARIKAPRVELSRLTVNEYRHAVADAVGTFRAVPPKGAKSSVNDGKGQGLHGEYFTSVKRANTLAFQRVDPGVQVDFNANTDELAKLKTDEIAAVWHGSVLAPESGAYEFIVKTEHSTQLWVNDFKKPLIDALIKSGSETEFRGTLHLLGGKWYPLRLTFARGSLGVRKDPKEKAPAVKTTIALEWKQPRHAAEPIAARHLAPFQAPTSHAPSIALPADDRSAGYERGTAVSKGWVQSTQDGALEAAAFVAAHLKELAGLDPSGDRQAQLEEYCVKLVERACRRPLTPELKKFYVDRAFAASKDPDEAVRRVVLLALQSPRFLYREAGGEHDAFDAASRLAFTLWDAPPDEALREAAAQGRLNSRQDVRHQAARMLDDPRAKAKLRAFFLQWLQVDQAADLARDADLFPGFDARVVSDLRTSLEMTVEDILWSDASDFRQLLLTPEVYANGRLAKLYGLDLPPDAPFQKVPTPEGERVGLLTHPMLMAQFAYPKTSSPIHRGVFVARNVLGVGLRQPPDAFTPLPPELHPKLTTRERIQLQTKSKECQGCHGIINNLGFALERYDAIGRFRTAEEGKAVDSTGRFVTRAGETVTFQDEHALAKFAAESEEAHEAFVARLFHFLVKQPILAYGPERLTELRLQLAENQYNIKRLVTEIAVETALWDRARPLAKPASYPPLKGSSTP